MAGAGGAEGGNAGGSDGPWDRWRQTLASRRYNAVRKEEDPSYAPRSLFGGRKNISINVGKGTNVTQAEIAEEAYLKAKERSHTTAFNPRKASEAGKKVVDQINDLNAGKGDYEGKSPQWRRNEAVRVLANAGVYNAAGRLDADFAGADKPAAPRGGGGGSRSSSSSSSAQQDVDQITSDLDAYIASLDLGSSGSSAVNAPTAAALAAQNPAADLGVASGAGISGTVLTSGVTEETSPSVLTPVSATPTTPYAGSSTLTEGAQVVDTVNGKVYPNKAAATAAGVKAWMPKTQWDALQATE